MEIFLIITNFIPLLFALIGVAEDQYKDVPKSGDQKKADVLMVINKIISSMVAVSTGGQKATWVAIEMIVSPLISLLAAISFPVHTD